MDINVSNKTIIRVLGITTVFLMLVMLLLKVQQQLIWLVIAGFLALSLEPAVSKLSKYLPFKSRALALTLVFSIFISFVSFILVNLVPPAISQATQAGPEIIKFTENTIKTNPDIYKFARANLGLDQLLANKEQILSSASSTGSFIFSSLGSAVASLTTTFMILLFTLLIILEGPEMVAAYWRYQPENKKEHHKKLLSDMYGSVTGFVNGTLIRCGIAGSVTMTILFLAGIPFAISLGFLIALLGIIPLVGGLLGATLIVVISFLYGGLLKGTIILVFFLIYSTFENYILTPIIFKKSVNISPLITTVAAIFGVVAGGFVGALIAIPAAASVQILVKDYLDNK